MLSLQRVSLMQLLRPYRERNEFWKNRVETIDEVLEPLLGKNPTLREQIFTALERMGKQEHGRCKAPCRA